MNEEYEEDCTTGGSKLPLHLINKDIIQFSNFDRDDQKGMHILRLLGLHLKKLSEEDKDDIITTLNGILNNKV